MMDAKLKIAMTALRKITKVPRAEFDMTTVAKIAQTALCEIDAIAPPVAAGSVDTAEFAELMQNVRHGLYAQSWPPLITYINAWGAQQREQGEYAAQSAAEDRICNLIAILGDEKLRAEKAEARAITAEDRLAAANNMLTGVNAELKNAEARSAELQEALDVAMLVVSLHAQ